MSLSNLQLFKVIPKREFIEKLALLYGIKELSSQYTFTLRDLHRNNTVEKLLHGDINRELRHYYINCKYLKYFEDLNEKKSVTILRHFLKIIDFKILSKEKYSNNSKFLLYEIIDNNYKNNISDFHLSFD